MNIWALLGLGAAGLAGGVAISKYEKSKTLAKPPIAGPAADPSAKSAAPVISAQPALQSTSTGRQMDPNLSKKIAAAGWN